VRSQISGGQLIDSSTSVAANYRAACRARSRAEFIAKLGVVLEESDESLFWLELIVDANLVTKSRAERLLKEADELTAIFTTSVKPRKLNPQISDLQLIINLHAEI
jgi:four helix bundle protein